MLEAVRVPRRTANKRGDAYDVAAHAQKRCAFVGQFPVPASPVNNAAISTWEGE